jgi:hypothetical protein
MNDMFFTRRIKATASTLRRVISDAPVAKMDVEEAQVAASYRAAMHIGAHAPKTAQTSPKPLKSKKESAQLLILRAPLPPKEDVLDQHDNAFSDIDGMAKRPPANSRIEPGVTNSKLMLMAENAVDAKLDEMGPERIQHLIEEIAPVRIANIFAQTSAGYVEQAVEAFAPESIADLVSKMAPAIVEKEVTDSVSEKVSARLAQELPGGLEASVSRHVTDALNDRMDDVVTRVVKQEMHDGMDDVVARIVKEEMQGAFGYSVTRKIRQLIHEELRTALGR